MKHPNIQAANTYIGKGAIIEGTIRGLNGPAKKISIGDHTYIGKGVEIICDDFAVGDYGKIHKYTTIHGNKVHIGHNLWCGQNTIIDGLGGVTIGDNCGIGAYSQLWSHIKYGDVLAGCNFAKEKELIVGKDVWFVGHCIVSPITAADRSMALVGSVVTRDMGYNCIYAGCPAVETGRKQFNEIVDSEKAFKYLHNIVGELGFHSAIKIAVCELDYTPDNRSWFFINERTYNKKGTKEEIEFIKYLLPEKAKFTPLK